ncbi:siderophore-interacting protein [Tenggerimyces flavus]|uniref:Siderophore-interacting protein n=1 Tax=Tenggerimyces flavus TaxID=1708749 RepID=A0ABV7YNM1_9ACTN|nr:siderophore-interacting protein [Tenggerimyces flavus]MBM7789347.1 NADPH-dependent ferric siderophore reductase [Tenggerimyces flavus]
MAITSDLPMRFYTAEVAATQQLTPGMVRIVFGGEDLADFLSTGVGDEYLRIFFPADGQQAPNLPVISDKGRWTYPDGVERSPMRTYTVREHRPATGEVVIDFVVHDGGVAATWAQRAKKGDVVAVNTPTGLYDPPADLAWQLLLTDSTGLPAVGRILDQCPNHVRTRVIVEVPSAEHQQPLATHGDIELVWVYGGNGHGRSQLDEILRSIELPEGPGYIWVAGETGVLRSVRKYLRHERGLPATAYKTIGYWTDKAEAWTEKFDGLDEKTRAWLWAVWDTDAPEEEQEDEYVARLESLGL